MNRRKRESEWEDRDGLIVSSKTGNMMAPSSEGDNEEEAAASNDTGDIITTVRPKGYRSVSGVEDGIDDQGSVESGPQEQDWRIISGTTGTAARSSNERWRRIWLVPLLPDNRFSVGHVKLLDGPAAVKLLKFVFFTFLGIICMFHFIRWVGWENDENLTLSDIWLYEGNLIIMDAIVFFFVGRLYKQKGVDHLEWLMFCLLANLYSSYITSFSFLQHSFTLYEMHCRWPWSLWMFVCVAAILVVGLILLHVRRAVSEGIFVQKLLEMTICIGVFLLPLLSSPYFHFHHWFAGWLIGMHCNFDVFWSRATMAWCFGCYVNGIAVYGRDPTLTCGYALYLSSSLHCPFLKCYDEAIQHPSNHTNVKPMIAPDWRNCTADTYHT